jgi:3-isopropylmalate/(R)-2-methylmalate dehydratase small subunit
VKLTGRVHKYGANVDTDAIIPARYLNVSEAVELARHAMEGIDVQFVKRVRPGDFIVAGANFGCGSSREHAPLAIKASGVACVVSKSFARIFFRNAINIGLPILTCEEAVEGTEPGDALEIELETGRIRNITRGRDFRAAPYPEFMLELIAVGGLIEHTRARLKAKGLIS